MGPGRPWLRNFVIFEGEGLLVGGRKASGEGLKAEGINHEILERHERPTGYEEKTAGPVGEHHLGEGRGMNAEC